VVLTATLPAEQSRKTCPMERPVQVPVAEFDDGETSVVRRTTNLAVHNIKAT
jgi:hypothetical protein